MNAPVAAQPNPADTNHDGKVDISDLVAVAGRFGQTSGSQQWDASADIIADGQIDIYDMVYVASRFS